jgi:regulatory protein
MPDRNLNKVARRRKSIEPEGGADLVPVREVATALLARRDFTIVKLREALQRRGCDSATVRLVVAELIEERVLDDARYAESYVAHHTERGRGPIRIAEDLRVLGIPLEVIDAALGTGLDWQALARDVRRRKFGPDLPETPAERVRQARFLRYRGFSADHIRAATGADFDPDL